LARATDLQTPRQIFFRKRCSNGHANLFLKDEWQLMGGLEALNGILLFGLSTAILFAIIQRV
jgi:hypothetical protein